MRNRGCYWAYKPPNPPGGIRALGKLGGERVSGQLPLKGKAFSILPDKNLLFELRLENGFRLTKRLFPPAACHRQQCHQAILVRPPNPSSTRCCASGALSYGNRVILRERSLDRAGASWSADAHKDARLRRPSSARWRRRPVLHVPCQRSLAGRRSAGWQHSDIGAIGRTKTRRAPKGAPITSTYQCHVELAMDWRRFFGASCRCLG